MMSEATLIKSHQHDYLNMSWTRKTTIDMLTCEQEKYLRAWILEKICRLLTNVDRRRNSLSPEKNTTNGYPVPNAQP